MLTSSGANPKSVDCAVNVGRARRRLLLLKALGGGSRLLRLTLEDLESLIELVDEEEELLSGILRLRLLSIHAMRNQEREGSKKERE